ncbi:hypothetical protein C0J52_22170 [Blattella germanica]|nr:hypothetical protein C0J52_22170 [Blattella germanica]
MAASIAGVFEDNLKSSVDTAKVLVVGAGGIGCEVLKNLVLSGFKDIEIIDLDTIDVSNLNRQFLFHKQHVGKSKAAVARESALKFNPNVTIKAYHDSITRMMLLKRRARWETARLLLHFTQEYHTKKMCNDFRYSNAGAEALTKESNEKGNVDRVSTRAWAQSCGYNPEKLFQKLFHDDIKYLLSMGDLWKKRRPPTPLVFGELPDAVAGSSKNEKDAGLKDLKDWSIAECAQIFSNSCRNLKNDLEALKEGDHLVWDKDDKNAMDFVAACANIRSYIFGIPQKNRFDIKSMAGNIIPAIATTNAIIAGIVVLHAFKVLQGKLQDCQTVYQRPKPNPRNRLIVREKFLIPPNTNCFICSNDPKVTLCVDIESMTVKELEEQVLKKTLHMVAPDAYLADIGRASDKDDDDDFLELVEDENNVSASDSKKRKTDETGGGVSKKQRTEVVEEDCTIVVN